MPRLIGARDSCLPASRKTGLKTKRACVLGGGRRLFFRVDNLEGKSTADLPPARQQLTGDFPEVPIEWVCIHVQVIEVGPVEDVVELKPDLEVVPFLEPIVLVNRQVRLGEVRPSETVLLFVAFGSDGRLCKLRRGIGEYPVQKRRLRRTLGVACHGRVIIIGPVRIVIAAVRRQPVNLVARCGARTSVYTDGNERVLVYDRERITALEDTGARKSPSPGQMADHFLPAVQAWNLVVERERETVRRIIRGRPVILRGVSRRGIYAGIVLGLGMRIRRIEKPVREPAADIENHGVVIP